MENGAFDALESSSIDDDARVASILGDFVLAMRRSTLGRAELEKLLRVERRAARLSSRGAGAQDLPLELARTSSRSRVNMEWKVGTRRPTATYLSISGPAPGLPSSALSAAWSGRCSCVQAHERCWAWPGCAVPLVLVRQYDVHAPDSAPLPWCARGRVVTSVLETLSRCPVSRRFSA